ncbi:MAG: hypothetical protein WC476_11880 [Phycisphaerae bacterium]|jgi:hypothetical protein
MSESKHTIIGSDLTKDEVLSLKAMIEHDGWPVLVKILEDIKIQEIEPVMNPKQKDSVLWHQAQGTCWTCDTINNLPESVEHALTDELEDASHDKPHTAEL